MEQKILGLRKPADAFGKALPEMSLCCLEEMRRGSGKPRKFTTEAEERKMLLKWVHRSLVFV